MKALFDTSVFVSTFLGDHEHHDASLNIFLGFKKREACCAAHSLAEVYKWNVRHFQQLNPEIFRRIKTP